MIDSIRINFQEGEMALMNYCLAFIMFGVALNIKLEDFRRIINAPKPVIVGLASQYVVLPVLTIYFIHAWDPYPSIALGLLLVAACPGGNISNYCTQLGRGNAALSVSLTSIVTICCVVITPLAFIAFAYFVPQVKPLIEQIELDAGSIFKLLATILLLPLIAGMLVNAYFKKLTAVIRKPISIVSLVIFAAFIGFALYANWDNLLNHLHLVLAIVIAHNVLAMLAGYGWAKWNKVSEADARAICFETGIQNSGLGLILIFNFFPELGGMMLVVACWAIWDMISALGMGLIWKNIPVKQTNVPANNSSQSAI